MADLKYRLTLNDQMSLRLAGAISRTKKLDNTIGRVQNRIIGFGSAFLGGQALVSFGQSSFEALKNYEFFSASLRTLMDGDEQAAKALQDQLIKFAAVTPFSLLEVQQGATRLIATGAAFGEVTDELRMLGDVSAGVGTPLAQVIKNFGQVRTRGKLQARDMNDFMTASIPIVDALSKSLGVAKDKIADMASRSEISFSDVKDAFRLMTSDGGKFFELMKKQSKTVGGRAANLGDAWEQLEKELALSQRGIIANTLAWSEKTVASITESIKATNELQAALDKLKLPDIKESPLNFIGVGGERTQDLKDKLAEGNRKLKATSDKEKAAIGQKILFERELSALKKKFNEDELERQKRLKKAETLGGRARQKAEEKSGRKLLSKEFFKQEEAVLLSLIDKAKGNVKLLEKLKPEPVAGGEGEGEGRTGSAGFGTGVEISGRRPQEINITIDSLVEQLNIEAATIEESNEELKEKVSQILIEVVNDANTTAR